MIFCYASECVHFHNGRCALNEITISDDYHQCEDYADYNDTPEYQTEFWRAVTYDGKNYKQKDKGRRGVRNGVAFFYQAKELEDFTPVIEERTGRMLSYRHLGDPEMLTRMEQVVAESGYVDDLPEWGGRGTGHEDDS